MFASRCVSRLSEQTYSALNGSLSCTPCTASGLVCLGGLIQVQPGYFIYSTGPGQFSTVECPPGLCLGAPFGTDQTVCQDGRLQSPDNLLCGACEPGSVWTTESCTDSSFLLQTSSSGEALVRPVILARSLALSCC